MLGRLDNGDHDDHDDDGDRGTYDEAHLNDYSVKESRRQKRRLAFMSFHLPSISGEKRRTQRMRSTYHMFCKVGRVSNCQGSDNGRPTFRTLFAPRRNPCADTARLSVAQNGHQNSTAIDELPHQSCPVTNPVALLSLRPL